MAEVFLNPMVAAINGLVGGIVFFSYNNKTYFRGYVKPRNPDTPAQRTNRNLFRDAMKSWQMLSSFEKDVFSRRARRLRMTGHNLYISRFMRSRSAGRDIDASDSTPAPEVPVMGFVSSSFHYISHSVTAQFMALNIPHPASAGDVHLPGP